MPRTCVVHPHAASGLWTSVHEATIFTQEENVRCPTDPRVFLEKMTSKLDLLGVWVEYN